MMKQIWPLERMEEEAVRFIQKYEPDEGYYLADSGGKDSRVLRKLTELAGVRFKAFHSFTTIDPPEVGKFLKCHFPDTTWHRPKGSFFQQIRKWFPPTIKRRWC